MVSTLWTAHEVRMFHGALTYADAHPRMVIRDFRLPRRFGRGSSIVKSLQQWNPDGLFCFLEQDEMDRLLRALPKPLPVVNACAVEPRPGVAVVSGRFSTCAEIVVRHLRHQGLRTIAMLLLENLPHMQANFIDAFNRIVPAPKSARMVFFELIPPETLDDPVAPVVPVPQRLADWLRQLPKPAGVFCPQSGGGGYLIRVCHALGLRVPDDISVVGGDDTDVCLACEPTLTSVVVSGIQVGQEAVQWLDRMIRGGKDIPEIVRVNTMDLHVRESTGARRVESCDTAAALSYIEQNACRGLTVEQLVKKTQHVSKVTFHKHFQAATGQSPGHAILQRQMEEARRLLAETHLSITLVAEYCGFGSSNDFARSFRRLEGQSPGEYRAGHSNPQ